MGPVFRVLPMGWSHSVYFVQCTHEHIAHQVAKLPWASQICHGQNVELGKPRYGIYIDNLFVVGQNEEEVNSFLQRMRNAYRDCGLPPKEKKTVWATNAPVLILGIEHVPRSMEVRSGS